MAIKKIIKQKTLTQNLPNLPNVHPVLNRIYALRGIKSPDELDKELNRLLSFHTLLGIQEASSCLAQALINQQRILVIGDFDADGATSTALAVSALKLMGAKNVDYLVPNRFEYGYGLTPEIVIVAAQNKKPDLIITVDNGISSHAGVAKAKELGIQVIITDHHLPGSDLPCAQAIVNPQLPGDSFPSKNLAGVGVIFYVMLALRAELRVKNWFSSLETPEPNMAQFLDLVALGTVADLVALDQNNRILVHQGLERIRSGQARPGILALLKVSGKNHTQIQSEDLGFSLGPRLNAAGRLADMSLGIECLLAPHLDLALNQANQLNALNEERRVIEQDMQTQAFKILEELLPTQKYETLPLGICIYNSDWHQGVIGLLASRLKEYFHRPAIIFAPGNTEQELKASARSIPGLHIRDLLSNIATRHPHLITKFGGHAMAAGLSIPKTLYPEFHHAFIQALEQQLDPALLHHELLTDGRLQPHDFSLDLAQQLQNAGPWGQAFPAPLFDGQFRIVDQRIVGNKHLKLTLYPMDSPHQLQAIAFNINLDQWPNFRTTHLQAAYHLDLNEYQGRLSLQLVLVHLEALSMPTRHLS